MYVLPRDIELKIISKMDIDTRIRTGIIFKLRIPISIIEKIIEIHKRLIIRKSISYVKLGPLRQIYNMDNNRNHREAMYTLTRYFINKKNIPYTLCHVSHLGVVKLQIYHIASFLEN